MLLQRCKEGCIGVSVSKELNRNYQMVQRSVCDAYSLVKSNYNFNILSQKWIHSPLEHQRNILQAHKQESTLHSTPQATELTHHTSHGATTENLFTLIPFTVSLFSCTREAAHKARPMAQTCFTKSQNQPFTYHQCCPLIHVPKCHIYMLLLSRTSDPMHTPWLQHAYTILSPLQTLPVHGWFSSRTSQLPAPPSCLYIRSW